MKINSSKRSCTDRRLTSVRKTRAAHRRWLFILFSLSLSFYLHHHHLPRWLTAWWGGKLNSEFSSLLRSSHIYVWKLTGRSWTVGTKSVLLFKGRASSKKLLFNNSGCNWNSPRWRQKGCGGGDTVEEEEEVFCLLFFFFRTKFSAQVLAIWLIFCNYIKKNPTIIQEEKSKQMRNWSVQ